jgi:hypothetical protein
MKKDDLRLEVKKYYTIDRNSFNWRVYQCADANLKMVLGGKSEAS